MGFSSKITSSSFSLAISNTMRHENWVRTVLGISLYLDQSQVRLRHHEHRDAVMSMVCVEPFERIVFSSAKQTTSHQIVKHNQNTVGEMFGFLVFLERRHNRHLFVHNTSQGGFVVLAHKIFFRDTTVKFVFVLVLDKLFELLGGWGWIDNRIRIARFLAFLVLDPFE